MPHLHQTLPGEPSFLTHLLLQWPAYVGSIRTLKVIFPWVGRGDSLEHGGTLQEGERPKWGPSPEAPLALPRAIHRLTARPTPYSTVVRPFPPELPRAVPFTLLSLGKLTFPQQVKFRNRFSAEEMLLICPIAGVFELGVDHENGSD